MQMEKRVFDGANDGPKRIVVVVGGPFAIPIHVYY